MLVLSRKPGEAIVFPGTNTVIRIVDVRSNGTVRIGIDAPPEVEVIREELLDKTPARATKVPDPG